MDRSIANFYNQETKSSSISFYFSITSMLKTGFLKANLSAINNYTISSKKALKIS